MVDEREIFETLHEKLAVLGAELLIRTLASPLSEKLQNHALATFCKKLKTTDGIADPKTMTAMHIDRMVRALGTEPGVRWNEAKILSTSLTEHPESLPLPCTGNSTLYVERIQPNSGKPMSGKEYRLGHPVTRTT